MLLKDVEEPLQIVSVIDAHFQNSNRLANSSFQDKRALVTAGPTIEVIDQSDLYPIVLLENGLCNS